MAFQTGTQVNAALGRTDFTPFLQGAMQGAQAQARGAENIAQGLAGLGQQVATGIEKYYKKQEEKQLNEQAIDTVSRILKTNPAFGDQIGLKPDASGNIDRKAIGSVIKSLGGAPNTIQFANTLNEFTRKQAEDTQAAQYAATVTEAQGRPFSMLKPISPTAKFRGEEMAAALAKTKSETAENLREKAGALGRVMTPAEVEALPAGTDYKGTPMPDGNIYVTGLSRFATPSQTNIKTGDDLLPRDIYASLSKQKDVAASAMNAMSSYEDSLKLLEGKIFTGAAANANVALAKVGEVFGIKSEELENTQVLQARLAIPVFSLVKQLGAGTGISNADREYAEMAAGGKITLNKQSIKRLVEIGQKASRSAISSYQETLDDVYPADNKEFAQARASLKLRKPKSLQEQADAIVGGN